MHITLYNLQALCCVRLHSVWISSGPLHDSVNFLHGRATCTARGSAATKATARHASLRHASATTRSLVYLHHDGVDYALKFFLFGLKFVFLSKLIFVQPVQCILHRLFYFFFVTALKLVFELLLLQSVAHSEAIVLQTVLRLDFRFVRLIFGPELLCFLHHAVDLCLRQTTFLVSDRNLIGLARGLVLG